MDDFSEIRQEKTYIVAVRLDGRRGYYVVEEMKFRAVSKAHALKKWHDYIEDHSGLEWESGEFEFLSIKEKGQR